MSLYDFGLNIDGLMGKPPSYSVGDTKVINPKREFQMNITRGIRLPLFVTGLGFLGKVVYDGYNLFLNGEPIEFNTYRQLIGGLGFLSAASSMYLKDQDSKSLEKQHSKVKAFFKELYEKAKISLPLPNPTPEPVPIQAYSTLDNYVDIKT